MQSFKTADSVQVALTKIYLGNFEHPCNNTSNMKSKNLNSLCLPVCLFQ